jgi:arabinogalactan endo-1,4-beta-galactosidase
MHGCYILSCIVSIRGEKEREMGIGHKLLAGLLSLSLVAAFTPSATLAFADTATADSSTSSQSSTEQSVFDSFSKIDGINDDSILGLDFSYYQQDVADGKVFHDYNYKKVGNVFDYVKDQGVNTVSVRVAVDAAKATDDAKYFSLENAAKTVKAANAAGLRTNVILMYSNSVTSKDSQTLPDGWNDKISGEELGKTDMGSNETWAIHHAVDYTNETLSYLKDQGATPSLVTIGNEVNYNFLGYTGDENAWKGWMAMRYLATLVKGDGVKVGFSVAAPDDASGIQYVVDSSHLNSSWIPCSYDYVGVNLYAYSGFDEKQYAQDMVKQFQTTESSAGRTATCYVSNITYPRYDYSDSSVTTESQAKNIYGMLKATAATNNASGLVLNQGEYVDSWNSVFDSDHALTSLATFAYAQGEKKDVSWTPTQETIYKYGLESGLKNQSVNISQIKGMNSTAIRGVDASSYEALNEAGVKFYDYDGNETPLMKELADNGVNYIRLRIWNNPYNDKGEVYGGGVNSVENDLKIAKEAAKYGMKVLLCFHYSDFWASPGVQKLPKAWQSDAGNTDAIANDIYTFTKDTIKQFQDAGCDVGMVQIGNEITKGMAGTVQSSYQAAWGNESTANVLCKYLKAGAKATREVSPKTLVALHLEGPNAKKYRSILNVWKKHNVDYDVLGTSYYPFWHQTTKKLSAAQDAAADYGKLFCVLETSWLNSMSDADGTTNQLGEGTADTSVYKVGVQGQVDVLSDQYKAMLSKDNGLGAFYWEPAWIPVKAGWANWKYNKEVANKMGTGWASDGAIGYAPDSSVYYKGQKVTGGSGWDNQSLFDFNGHPLQSLKFYKQSQTSDESKFYVIHYVDEKGKAIATDRVERVYTGSSVKYGTVKGYKRVSVATTGQKDGVTYRTVTCRPILKAKLNKTRVAYNGRKHAPAVKVTLAGKVAYKSTRSRMRT